MLDKIQKAVVCSVILFFINLVVVDSVVAKNDRSINKSIATKSLIKPSKIKKININTASIDSLLKINGMSKIKAKEIINYRSKNGKFKSLKDLLKVKCRGINEKWLSKISKFLRV